MGAASVNNMFDLRESIGNNKTEIIDVGTSAEARMLTFIPRVLYEFRRGKPGFRFTLGLGFGMGYTELAGDMYVFHDKKDDDVC